jgi:murein L,D-transpeptidase YcbB/YkuD
VAAVKSFQRSQGLSPDGQVGGETLRLLNVPIDSRIQTLILNMERWRWIPKSLEPDYLMVNIPEFKLHVFEKGQEKITMKVIVGKTMNSTPIFSDKLEFVVLSPYWNVPMSIIQKELAPKLMSDPGYLERLDMEVVTNKGDQIDPSTIDWSSVDEKNFKYTVRRRPGPKNDLGDVKFIFPNSNDIYLHDTPHDELFSETSRDFSHGCVRVEKPIDLAEYLLRNVPGYDRSKIESVIAERQEKFVSLKQKLPVYLVYFTASADANGNVTFHKDIYGHDRTLAAQYFN